MPLDPPGGNSTQIPQRIIISCRCRSPSAYGKVSLFKWTIKASSKKMFLGRRRVTQLEIINVGPAVRIVAATRNFDTGPVKMYEVTVNLADPRIRIGTMLAKDVFLSEEAQWPRQPVSQLVADSGAVLGINANFFEMTSTMNPRGMHIQAGRLVKSHNTRWNASIGFTATNRPFFGYWHWRGGVRLWPNPSGGNDDQADRPRFHPTAGLNITTVGPDEITLYRSPWRKSLGIDRREQGDEDVVELVLDDLHEYDEPDAAALQAGAAETSRIMRGTVREVRRNEPGVELVPGQLVVSGCGAGAAHLSEIRTGDVVELFYTIEGETFSSEKPDWRALQSVVAGNLVVLERGKYGDPRVTTLPHQHPRTFIATNHHETQLIILIVDGRSEESVGLTYKQAADYLLSIGAYNALNLDGGGSTTLAIRDPETDRVRVVNVPCEGAERPVPDGLAIFVQPE